MMQPAQPMRITLAALNSQYIHAALAPWCLKAGLDAFARTPHQTLVVEGTVNEPLQGVLARIVQTKPDVLGLCCYIWNMRTMEQLLPMLRAALPHSVLVLGGPEVSPRPREVLLRYPEVDHVIAGEGELPFARLVDALGNQGAFTDVPGLCTRQAGELHTQPPYFHQGLPPSPIRPDYLQALKGRIAYLETSRGCPYSCAFCLSGGDDKPRWQALEEAQRDIVQLANADSRTIKFVDRTFNADRGRAAKLMQFILQQVGNAIPRDVCFHFEIAGDLMDDAFLDTVSQAPQGLFQFEIGMQSMNEGTLESVRRRTDMGLLTRQLRRLLKAGTAHVHLDLIAGLPKEDLQQFARGFDQAYALRPHALQLGFLKLIHGSAMREQPEVYPCQYEPQPPYQVTGTPWLSGEDLRTLAVVERALDKLHNSGRFPRTLSWLTRARGLRPFSLFHTLGQAVLAAEADGQPLSLDKLTDCVYRALCGMLPHHQALIRDLMLLDRLSSTPTTVLPISLRQRDKRYFAARRGLDAAYPRPQDSVRAVGLLYTSHAPCAVFCDYVGRNPVTSLYPLKVVPLHLLPRA